MLFPRGVVQSRDMQRAADRARQQAALIAATESRRLLEELDPISPEVQSALDTKLEWVAPPALLGGSGTEGQLAYDTDYFYICVATDTWRRVPLETW